MVASLHQQWRLKVAGDVGQQSSSKAVHFSGLMSIDKACADKIRELLTNSISEIKPLVADASSKEVYFLGVDFYEPV